MYNADGEFTRELAEEKTDEELAEVLSAYRGNPFSWWRIGLSLLTIVVVVMVFQSLNKVGGNRSKELLVILNPMDMEYEEKLSNSRAKTEFKSDTNHKGHFMNYALNGWGDDEHSTEEILKLADEVDPENSLYHYLAAGNNYKDIVEREKPNLSTGMSEREKLNRVVKYEVLDEKAYSEALEHIIEAGQRQGITDHLLEIRMMKLYDARMNIPQDFLGRIVMITKAFSAEFHSIKLLNTSSMFTAKFYELSQNGTESEVRFWKDEYLKLLDTLLEHDIVLIDALVANAILHGSLTNMRAAAAHVGMDDEVRKITELLDALFLEKQARDKKFAVERERRENDSSYSRLGYLNQLTDIPILTHLPSDVILSVEKDATPGRLLDHAFMGRVMVMTSFLLIGMVCIGMWIYYWSKPKEIRVMSMKILSSISVLDGVIIVFCGVVLPVIAYVFINEKTSLGAREWGMYSANFTLPVTQFMGMLLTVFTLSVVLLRRGLVKSLPEMVTSARWYHWSLPCVSLLVMLLVGMSDSNSEVLPWTVSILLLSITILAWIGMSIGQCFIGSNKLVKASICRGLLPLYAVAMIVMFALNYYYHAQEFKYVAEDKSFAFKEEHLGMGELEFRVAQELRKKILRDLEIIR